MWLVFLQGFALCFGLIVPIGAQNAFVLRQGLRREHVTSVVFFCGAADSVLILAGVYGMAQAIGDRPFLSRALALGGAVFLAWYGWKAIRRIGHADKLRADPGGEGLGRSAAFAQAAAFTLLNPHVYLDAVVLLGAVAATVPAGDKASFMVGAVSASFLWFMALGFGARLLRPLFRRARTWQLLDALIGVVMLSIAAGLLQFAWERWPF